MSLDPADAVELRNVNRALAGQLATLAVNLSLADDAVKMASESLGRMAPIIRTLTEEEEPTT